MSKITLSGQRHLFTTFKYKNLYCLGIWLLRDFISLCCHPESRFFLHRTGLHLGCEIILALFLMEMARNVVCALQQTFTVWFKLIGKDNNTDTLLYRVHLRHDSWVLNLFNFSSCTDCNKMYSLSYVSFESVVFFTCSCV